MRLDLQGLADAVAAAAERVGLSERSLLSYRKGCQAVVGFCVGCGIEEMTAEVCREFVGVQQDHEDRGELRQQLRRDRARCAKMMLEFAQTGRIVWRVFPQDTGLSGPFAETLARFRLTLEEALAPATVTRMAGDTRAFLLFLERIGRSGFESITVDDIRAHMVEMSARRPAGLRNVVKALKAFFAFLNGVGLSDVKVDGLLAKVAAERVRAFPCFTREEIDQLIGGIDTDKPCGKRDYAMVMLAVVTGMRCCDIISLRLDEIDWPRHEIRLVQSKTSQPLALPLSPQVGNAIADWILHGRPDTAAPEVFIRLLPPFVKLSGAAGSAAMSRWLAKADIAREPGDGKTFHALRRTAGTRLIESGASLPLAAQILGHAHIDSSRRYIALAGEQMRQCCQPLDSFACTKQGLR